MAHTGLIGPASAPEVHVMSFNIRRRVPHLRRAHPDRWERRASLVAELLAAERPTLLGLQEALPDQRDAALAALGGAYRSVGVGRDASGGGESCPLVWDSARLELLDWKQSALSDSPEQPGSRSWGNPIPRTVVTAAFRDKATGHEFRGVNTHLDPFSPRSRLRSASAILEIAQGDATPVLVMGDFNAGADSPTHRTLAAGDVLRDSWSSAAERVTAEWGTFVNYRAPKLRRARIDWILASPAVAVRRAAVNRVDYLAGAPSDHLPVHATVEIGGAT